jgi:hypothetical protein
VSVPQVDLPLVPLQAAVMPWSTDVGGAAEIEFPWPAAPPGAKLDFQVGCPDLLAPQGWSASNGLMASSP